MPDPKLKPKKSDSTGELLKKMKSQARNRLDHASGLTGTKQIRAYHRIGMLLLRILAEHGDQARASTAQLATQLGRGQNAVYKSTKFARTYDSAELERLVSVAPTAGFSHVIQLLSINDVAKRKKLERELGSKQLTVLQLTAEVKKRYGTRRKGGRP